VGKTGGDSERLIQTFSGLELFEVGVAQSLQMAHLATLGQLQRPDLSRMFGKVKLLPFQSSATVQSSGSEHSE
jgi:hypothetical protein